MALIKTEMTFEMIIKNEGFLLREIILFNR
jgi:hypothetical protein